MANILEELTKGIASVVGDSDPDAKIINAQSLVDELKKEEEKLFAVIGRKAIEVDGDEKFGEDAVKLRLKQKEIIDAEEKVRIAKEEKEASNKEQTGNTCPGCGIEVAQNISEVNFFDVYEKFINDIVYISKKYEGLNGIENVKMKDSSKQW